jgi:squalene-associated FAD-dependent desaturase
VVQGAATRGVTTSAADVVVIGAGCAGLSAAVRLADAGLRVAVVEQAPRLGGRASAFTDRETGERVDNGQHVLFGCYRETYAFLDRVGVASQAPLQPRMRVAMADAKGRSAILAPPDRRPPWHLVEGVLRWRALPLRDRLTATRLAPLLFAARRRGAEPVAAAVDPRQTVSEWLAASGQSPALCAWLWRPLAIAALNESPDVAAAAPFVRVLAELFGPRVADSAIGMPRVPLDELFGESSRRAIERAGGEIRTKSIARVRIDGDGVVRGVRTGDDAIDAPAVVSAVAWHAIGQIWDGAPPAAIAGTIDRAVRIESSPIVTVNLWIDDATLEEPFTGLVDGPMHWVFDKRAIFGERAGHLSMVASGARELAPLGNDAIATLAIDQLRRTLPSLAALPVRRSVVVREPRATFSLAPGPAWRPGPVTALRGFYLAGDWTDTGLPATIESAVLSGRRAADALLRDLRPGVPDAS